MKYILIMLIFMMLGYLSASFLDKEGKDMGKQEIINDCQSQGYFTYNGLTFSCKQLFVVE